VNNPAFPHAPADAGSVEYAGFWIRVLAVFIDSILILCVMIPLLGAIYGWDYFLNFLEPLDESRSLISSGTDFFISYVLPAVATIVFWKTRQATPGKMMLSMKIVDAETGGPMSGGQAVGRYFAYFVSLIFMLGYLWVAFDPRKQSWHDKLAGTVVVVRR
jgi:uncharacterized RDD family membrane protein YckC